MELLWIDYIAFCSKTNVIYATIRLCGGKHSTYFGCKNNIFTNKSRNKKYHTKEKHLDFILEYTFYKWLCQIWVIKIKIRSKKKLLIWSKQHEIVMISTMKACLMIWININIQPCDMQIINYKFHLNLHWIHLHLWAISIWKLTLFFKIHHLYFPLNYSIANLAIINVIQIHTKV